MKMIAVDMFSEGIRFISLQNTSYSESFFVNLLSRRWLWYEFKYVTTACFR